ncbi:MULTISPECIES: LysR family transcriptional regulator [Rhodanobacter]|uniref:LysR family transcriptional regulator n=1 Tax=Rhodanobacter hydrolyticus TaxID=2250595 RepID=A0ABW8J500_9GAMM|nr:LysR family transcriptional regulator [Rhodanobacter sp. 7MK24]MBD8879506.1 LysR family transcriptional regulator [Rhodanobacter sp. 7MK24]
MRDDYALRAFRAIAEQGSFTRAAAALDVTASALSQTLRQLETQLGTRLLHRTTRRVGLSEAGHALLQRIAPALNELDAAMDALRQHGDRPAGLLRITVPDVVATALLDPLLGEFMARWPDVRLDIHVDNGFSDLIADGFDAGIRLGESLQRDMVAVPVDGPMRSVVVGSPAYFARHGRPMQPRELGAHDCVNFRKISNRAIYRWEFAHKSGPRKGQWFDVSVEGRLTVNSIPLGVRAAIEGAGLANVLEPFAREALDDGRLESVLDDWLPPYEGFHLYYPSRFQVPPKLRVFIDFLRQRQAAAGTTQRPGHDPRKARH